MIEFFMARGLDYTERRELLRLCLPGVLRHSALIDFCLGVHLQGFNEERLLKLASDKGFIQSMCSHSFKTYPLHWWAGFGVSIPGHGIVKAAHRIFVQSQPHVLRATWIYQRSANFDTARFRRN